jgi:hypothetical protein
MKDLREATLQAAKDDDQLAMLTTLGVALHATQDFYSHSNWVETHPRAAGGPYRTETFLSVGPPRNAELVTGKYPEDRKSAPVGALIHGNYDTGLNKDSQVRPNWDEAYVFAYCASHEIAQLMEQWSEEARPGLWKRAQQFEVAANDQASLAYDLRAVRNISMWISARNEDGHWKGNRSGFPRFFPAFSGKWVGRPSSIFVKQISERKLHKRLTAHLYSETGPLLSLPGPAFTVPRFALDRRAVLVRTTLVKETNDVGRFERDIDPGGAPDFYPVITIGAQVYTDRVIQNQKEFPNPWFEIHFVDGRVGLVPMVFQLWDEDDTDPGGEYKDDHIDINPLANKRDLELTLQVNSGRLSGDLTGIHNSIASAFTVAGAKPDRKRAQITVYIDSYPLTAR